MNTRKTGKGDSFSKFKDKKKSVKVSNPSKGKPTFKGKPAANSTVITPRTDSESTIESTGEKKRFFPQKERVRKGDPMPTFNENEIRLNKFLSNAGVASRREADVLIGSGVVSVNDVIVLEMGYKIKPGDVVKYDGQTINAEPKRYVLLNKPKDFIGHTV